MAADQPQGMCECSQTWTTPCVLSRQRQPCFPGGQRDLPSPSLGSLIWEVGGMRPAPLVGH